MKHRSLAILTLAAVLGGCKTTGNVSDSKASQSHKNLDSSKKPNVIVILTDDQGWTGSSIQMLANRSDTKSDFYKTPNLERLAKMGMIMTNGYAAPNCSPSRLALLTGKTPARLKLTDIIERAGGVNYEGQLLLPPGQDQNPTNRIFEIPASETTIAEMVKKDEDYATAHFGKWHLSGGGPANHGFDSSDGATGNGTGNKGGKDPKLSFSLEGKARQFIKLNTLTHRPFYLQVSMYAVHEGYFALPETLAKFKAMKPGKIHKDPLYAAMTADMDTAIGGMLDAIEDPNGDGDKSDSIASSTYIVFLADNGAVDGDSDNIPLQGGKATAWEGGIRVPFLVAGPGIAHGSRSDVPVAETDIWPTVAEWVGAKEPKGERDGGSFARLVRNETDEVEGRKDQFFFHFPHYQIEKGSKPMSAIREKNMKLVHFFETGENKLFDLSADMGENIDIAPSFPDVVKDLQIKLRDYLKKVDAPMPRLNPQFGKGTFPDVDGDGLDDDWEFRELLTTKYGPGDDPDGDGKTNQEEFAAKTDPLS